MAINLLIYDMVVKFSEHGLSATTEIPFLLDPSTGNDYLFLNVHYVELCFLREGLNRRGMHPVFHAR